METVYFLFYLNPMVLDPFYYFSPAVVYPRVKRNMWRARD